jgi:hypothetical protein
MNQVDAEHFCRELREYVEHQGPGDIPLGSTFIIDSSDPDIEGSAAKFFADPIGTGTGIPAIFLYPAWYCLDAAERTFVLAHEFGHYQIWKRDGCKTYSEIDRLRKQELLMEAEYRRIIDDEADAWARAEGLLREKQFGRVDEFDAFRERSMDSYRTYFSSRVRQSSPQ